MDENNKEQVNEQEVQENKPTNVLKRIIAGLLDIVILFFVHFGLYSLTLITPLGNFVNNYTDAQMMIQDICKLETGYGEEVQIEQGKEGNYHLYTKYKEDGITVDYYYIVKNVTFETREEQVQKYNAYVSLIKENKTYTVTTRLGETYTISHDDAATYRHIHNYVLTISVGFVLEAIYFFVVPMIKNNGMTPGMFIANIRMISSKDYMKPRWSQYLGRFTFIFFIESSLPYFVLAQWTMVVVPAVLAIFLFIFRKKNQTLHDLVSRIMVIERTTFVDHSKDEDIIDASEIDKKTDNKEKA